MNRADLAALRVGDSIVGFNSCWTTEFKVAAVSNLRYVRGRACNDVCVNLDGSPVWATVREGDDEIRTPENLAVA